MTVQIAVNIAILTFNRGPLSLLLNYWGVSSLFNQLHSSIDVMKSALDRRIKTCLNSRRKIGRRSTGVKPQLRIGCIGLRVFHIQQGGSKLVI